MTTTCEPKTNGMVAWSLAACARIHGVTIRQIASRMQITLKRVREVRDSAMVPALVAADFVAAIRELDSRS